MDVKIKRVYDPMEKNDGYRVLADKMWPRGIKKENLHYDLWAKDISPSTELREWYHADKENRWDGFHQKYLRELENSPVVKELVSTIKREKVITLLFASKDTAHNNAVVLQAFLQEKLS